MSKKFLSLLILSTIISSVALSQSLHLGIKGGANVLKIDGKYLLTFGFKFFLPWVMVAVENPFSVVELLFFII